jgi:hypothetical protein
MALKDILTNTQRFRVSSNPLTAMNTEIIINSRKPQVKYFESELNEKEKKQVVMKLIRFLKTS